MLDNIYASALAGSLALSGGGTGLISVPSASLMPLNSFEYQHTNAFLSAAEDSGIGLRQAGDDRALTDHLQFSLIPRLEFGARLTTWYFNDSSQPDLQDLSGHVKLQLLDLPNMRLALGARDISGEATSLAPAEFVVADANLGPFLFVAGFGRSDVKNVALDGAFGGVQYSPTSWLDLLVDHDAVATQAGIRLHATYKKYSVYVKAYATDGHKQDSAIAAGVRLPLGQDEQLVPRLKSPVWGLKPNPAVTGVEHRDALHETWASDGLARSYGQNLAASADGHCGKEVRHSGYNIPLLQLTCDETAYRVDWLRTQDADKAAAPHVRLRLDLVQRYAVGSEVGRMDYSIAARPSLQALLYAGLSTHVAFDVPVANTDDYDSGGFFENEAYESGVSEFMAQYTIHALPGVFVQAGGGQTRQARELLQFVRGDLAAMLFEGRLGLHYSYTDFAPEFTGVAESQSLGKAFLWIQPATYAAQITAGRFLYQDSGARLDLFKYLGRVRLGLYYKDDGVEKAVGMSVSAPLGGHRGFGNRWVSVAGSPRYSAFFETQVDAPTGENLLRPNFLRQFHPQRNLLDDVLDQWRASPLYVRSR